MSHEMRNKEREKRKPKAKFSNFTSGNFSFTCNGIAKFTTLPTLNIFDGYTKHKSKLRYVK